MPPLLTWLVQLVIVIGAARIAGRAAVLLRQPRVIGEMAAGILLGPSLFGWLAPDLARQLLGSQQLGALNTLSQLGLLLFMFLVGLEIQPGQLRRTGPAAAISLASIIVPFGLGVAATYALAPQLVAANTPPLHVALFIGTALSVTAFPVLTRILSERGMLRTPLGTLVVVCAAANDIVAWCLLAGVMVLVQSGQGQPLWGLLLGVALYGAAMLTIGRALAARLLPITPGGRLSHGQLAGLLLALIGSAAFTEWLGIHALFGAFLAGAIMPRDTQLLQQLREKLEDLTVVLLLPLYFAAAGLRANIGLLNDSALWAATGLLLAAAVIGKLGGAALAARAGGKSWRGALAIGTLMNTRGLMELVVAGVGLESGVITPAVFTMLVLIALITTCMTGPLLEALRVTPQQNVLERDAEITADPAL